MRALKLGHATACVELKKRDRLTWILLPEVLVEPIEGGLEAILHCLGIGDELHPRLADSGAPDMSVVLRCRMAVPITGGLLRPGLGRAPLHAPEWRLILDKYCTGFQPVLTLHCWYA